MDVTFLLNGETVRLSGQDPTRTLLDYLREERRLTGTKEGCNEGDCGACTVIVQDESGVRALNSCILFLPQLHGRAVRTVEGVAAPDGQLHPVQQAMIDHHGSQCGFCTPGFITSMAAAHMQGRTDHDVTLAGNLCRCTGYAPIRRAAEAAAQVPAVLWLQDDPAVLAAGPADFAPESADALANWYQANPDATLVAGATDVGLWVTKQMRDLPKVAFLNRCRDLQQIEVGADSIRIGAGVTVARLREEIAAYHPSWAAMLTRYGSEQVRAAATIGGNIANGSPIGDNPPVLIALGARLHLRKGSVRREIAIEDFFVDYGKQDRAPGEFVEAVTIPRSAPGLRVWKISKRFDQDISAVLGAFDLRIEAGIVISARIAFGGMAAVPKRAAGAETALIGKPWNEATVAQAEAALKSDFTPLSDMRASAAYRSESAAALLRRYWQESVSGVIDVREIAP